ncbi:MAG TPA: GldG family protein [Opitutaceae bacterium]|jgi:hypothetical protein
MRFFESIRAARWLQTANLISQAILFLTLFAGLNYVARNPGWREDPLRIDLTHYRRFSLSPETLAYLRALGSPVRIVVTSTEAAAPADLKGLLREYSFATEANAAGRITVEYLNVDLNRRAAEQLDLERPGVVALLCADRRQVLPFDSLYTYRDRQRLAFDGEARLTQAVLEVSSPERKTLYFLTGHQELQPDDTDPNLGLSLAADALRERGYEVRTLDLSATHDIPEDASVLVSARPRSEYSAREQELLRRYLSAREGRMILLAAPGTRPGLARLLADWGLMLDDGVVTDSKPGDLTEDGDLIVRRFAAHPATTALLNGSFEPRLRLGSARTIQVDSTFANANGLEDTVLAWLPPTKAGLAVAAAHAAPRDNLPFSVRNGRFLVIGSGDLFDNARIARQGALDFLLGCVNWMADRDRELNIPARPLERFQLSLSDRELQNLRYSLMFAVPGAAALLGLIVYWTRRS